VHLLFLNHNVIGRGTYVRAFSLARELVLRGREVTLVTTSEASRLHPLRSERDGVNVIEAPDLWWGPARTGWDPFNTVRRMQLLRGQRFDLVHAFDSRPAVVLPALAKCGRSDTPLVMDWADWWGRGGRIAERSGWMVRTFFGPIETWFEEAFRLRAVAATTICSALAERLVALGFPAERILHLPNGCGAPDGLPERAAARASLGIAAEAIVLLHVGVIMRADLTLLLDAFRRARAQVSGLRLVFVGATGRTAAELSDEGITHTGFVADEQLHRWLAAADAGVLPMHDTIGHRGRWPSKLSDYMRAGLPTIVTAVGDVGRLVEDHASGWTTAPTAPSMAAAMVRAARDADAPARGLNARGLATGELSWPSMSERLESFYAQVQTQWSHAA
jgi:glycosyltransferase involved in cell wall biosynthesis